MNNLKIEIDLNYDTDNSIEFDENFKILRYSVYGKPAILLYTRYGNLSDDFSPEDYFIIDDTKQNRVNLLRYLLKNTDDLYSELKTYSINTLYECLLNTYDGIDLDNMDDIEAELNYNNITFTSDYVIMSSRGYNQGDYVEIFVNVKECKEKLALWFKESEHQEYFDNMLWNSAIFGDIEISFNLYHNAVTFTYDETFDFREISNNCYEIDLNVDYILQDIKSKFFFINEDDLLEIKNKLLEIDYTDINYPKCG